MGIDATSLAVRQAYICFTGYATIMIVSPIVIYHQNFYLNVTPSVVSGMGDIDGKSRPSQGRLQQGIPQHLGSCSPDPV